MGEEKPSLSQKLKRIGSRKSSGKRRPTKDPEPRRVEVESPGTPLGENTAIIAAVRAAEQLGGRDNRTERLGKALDPQLAEPESQGLRLTDSTSTENTLADADAGPNSADDTQFVDAPEGPQDDRWDAVPVPAQLRGSGDIGGPGVRAASPSPASPSHIGRSAGELHTRAPTERAHFGTATLREEQTQASPHAERPMDERTAALPEESTHARVGNPSSQSVQSSSDVSATPIDEVQIPGSESTATRFDTPSAPDWPNRHPLSRTNSLAQFARDLKQQQQRAANDTRAFYNNSGPRPSTPPAALSRNHSYTRVNQLENDTLAMDYLIHSNTKPARHESTNLLYRTGSRIQFDTKEFGSWYPDTETRKSSRRNSVGSSSGSDSDNDGVLHIGRRFRTGQRSAQISAAASEAPSDASDSDDDDDDDSALDEFANSKIVRFTDWLLGLPQNSPNSLQGMLKKKKRPRDAVDKRLYREKYSVTDPVWILAVAAVVADAMS